MSTLLPSRLMRRLVLVLSMTMACLPALAAAVAAGVTGPAVPTSPDPLRHALIIGVSTYADTRIPPLPGVPSDLHSARRIAQAMGIPDAHITELRDAQASKQEIVVHLRRLAERAGEGSRVLVYFSGHGTRWFDAAADGCVEGLLTHDGLAIVNREFATLVQPLGVKADKVVIMFDACHSGGVGSLRSAPRPGPESPLRPKFFVKADATPNACSRPANMRTRSLLGAGSADQLPENVVQITSSRPDEVSFDEAGKGGLATQGVRDCMLGQARDLDGSGAITLAEIEACAQEVVRQKVSPWPDLLPHHVSVRGLRNLIPVPVQAPTATAAAPPPAEAPSADSVRLERDRLQREQAARAERERLAEQQQAAARAEHLRQEQERLAREQSQAEAQRLAAELAEQLRAERAAAAQALQEERQREEWARQREQAERLALAAAAAAAAGPAAQAGTAATAPAPAPATPSAAAARVETPAPVAAEAAVAAVAALGDLYAQRDLRHTVAAHALRNQLKIGQDLLELNVTSSRGGHLYIVLLGSDETSFYLLFPNAMDRANRLQPGATLRLPRAHWQVQASGPPGVDQLLVMVTDEPRDLKALSLAPADAAAPFTYTAAHAQGRSRLINFMLGEGLRQGSARFGAAWLRIEETP